MVRNLDLPNDTTGLTNFLLSKQGMILEKIKKRHVELGIAPEDTHAEVKEALLSKSKKNADRHTAQQDLKSHFEGKDLDKLRAHLSALKQKINNEIGQIRDVKARKPNIDFSDYLE